MRVLQVNNHHQIRGGSDAVYFYTSALLQSAGHRVVPFAARGPADAPSTYSGHFAAAADTARPRPRDLPRFLHNGAAARALAGLLAAEGPFDVAHLHITHGRLTPAILPVLRKAGIRVVQTLHEYKLACPVYTLERNGAPCEDCVTGSTLNALRHRCKGGSLLASAVMLAEFWSARLQGDQRLVDKFICVSDFQRQILLRAGLSAEKLTVLHNFVQTEDFRPAERRGDYLLYYGRIETLKGLPTLLDAVETGSTRLVICGSGSWDAALRARIAGNPRIDHRGFVSGLPLRDLIAGARAVVVPSEWYENCPMTVIEAKASGTPVIAAAIGGIPELVRDGVDGLLFPAGDADALAACISALGNLDLAAMGRAARADALARFSPQAHLDALLAIYQDRPRS